MGAQSCEGHTPRACSHPCSPTSLLLAKQAKGGNTHEPHQRRQHRPGLDGEESHVRGQEFALVNLNLLKGAFAAPLQTHMCLRVALMRPMGTRAGRKEPGKAHGLCGGGVGAGSPWAPRVTSGREYAKHMLIQFRGISPHPSSASSRLHLSNDRNAYKPPPNTRHPLRPSAVLTLRNTSEN